VFRIRLDAMVAELWGPKVIPAPLQAGDCRSMAGLLAALPLELLVVLPMFRFSPDVNSA
jgi:hypothetical protein